MALLYPFYKSEIWSFYDLRSPEGGEVVWKTWSWTWDLWSERCLRGSCHREWRSEEWIETQAENYFLDFLCCFFGVSLQIFLGWVSSKWWNFSTRFWKAFTRFFFWKTFLYSWWPFWSWIIGSEIFKTNPFLASSRLADCTCCYILLVTLKRSNIYNLWYTSRKIMFQTLLLGTNVRNQQSKAAVQVLREVLTMWLFIYCVSWFYGRALIGRLWEILVNQSEFYSFYRGVGGSNQQKQLFLAFVGTQVSWKGLWACRDMKKKEPTPCLNEALVGVIFLRKIIRKSTKMVA